MKLESFLFMVDSVRFMCFQSEGDSGGGEVFWGEICVSLGVIRTVNLSLRHRQTCTKL